jgi:hypothetical protein
MIKTVKDCTLITASICSELTPVQQALLLGLLTGEYIKHPESKFWNVIENFMRVVKGR